MQEFVQWLVLLSFPITKPIKHGIYWPEVQTERLLQFGLVSLLVNFQEELSTYPALDFLPLLPADFLHEVLPAMQHQQLQQNQLRNYNMTVIYHNSDVFQPNDNYATLQYYKRTTIFMPMINRNNLNQMKKGVKKPSNRLIVDEFQKIKKSQIQSSSKSSASNGQRGAEIKFKVEEVACKFCNKFIPQQNLMYHQKVCQSRMEGENYYDMIYNKRPQHHHKLKEERVEAYYKDEEQPHDDYYHIPKKIEYMVETVPQNKPKRPMSALNKKIEMKPKSSLKIEEKQARLKKATSSSKLKDEIKHCYPSKEKQEKSKPASKYEQVYFKNTGQKKQLTLYPSNATKLKKKNANMAQRFQHQQRSFEERPERPLRRPDSRSKRQQRPKMRFDSEQDEATKINHRQHVRLDPPQITTQKLKEIVREKLREDKEVQKEKKREAESLRRQPVRQQPQPRQPSRAQVRNDRQTQRQPRSNRNQPRNRNIPNQRNRPTARNPRFVAPNSSTFLNLVSRTINNQLEMMNNQFAAMSNIFENFSNFVNINIDSHPNYYQFETHQFHASSDQDSSFNSDSSHSYSSSYDDYYDDEEQPEGMDEDQLNSIQNKRYRVEEHGQNQCTICLIELRNGDIIKQLFCDHLFHAECIEEWLRRKSACPVCRDQLGTN